MQLCERYEHIFTKVTKIHVSRTMQRTELPTYLSYPSFHLITMFVSFEVQ